MKQISPGDVGKPQVVGAAGPQGGAVGDVEQAGEGAVVSCKGNVGGVSGLERAAAD